MEGKIITYFLLGMYCCPSIAANVEISDSTKVFNNAIMENLKKNHTIIDLSDPLILKAALKSLVAKKNNNVNEVIIDNNLTYMEFSFSKKPTIYFHKRDETLNISYNMFADIGVYPSGQGIMNLISNNTNFNILAGKQGKIEIDFEYKADDKSNSWLRKNEFEKNKADKETILKKYPKQPFLNQSVIFKFVDVSITSSLKMPSKITLLTNNSSSLYPCYFTGDAFWGSFKGTDNSYKVIYRCEKLPNFNDYGENLKIIFDNSEFL